MKRVLFVTAYLGLVMLLSCTSKTPVKKENIKSYVGNYKGVTDLYEVEATYDSITGEFKGVGREAIRNKEENVLKVEVELDSLTKLPIIDVVQLIDQLNWGWMMSYKLRPIKLLLNQEGVVELDTNIILYDDVSWEPMELVNVSLRIDTDSGTMFIRYDVCDANFKLTANPEVLQTYRVSSFREKARLVYY